MLTKSRAGKGLRLGMSFGLLMALVIAGSVAIPQMAQAAPVDLLAQETITYVVRSGDSLLAIAARYGVTTQAIVRANNLANPDVIYVGQKLIIPISALSATATPSPGPLPPTATVTPAGPVVTPAPDTVTPTGATVTPAPVTATPTDAAGASLYHVVQLGDTLGKIGGKYGVTVAAIVQANNIKNPDLLWVGQKLLIPGGAAPKPTATAAAGPTVYTVAPGDTLSQIAQRFGTTVSAIVAANSLPSADSIIVGTRLLIPRAGDSSGASVLGRPTKFVVSISQQRCWLYRDDVVIAKWVCSTGRSGSGTMPGTFRIQSKIAKAYGSTWNIWMPYWLGIYWAGSTENGIHGLPWNAKTGVQVWTGYVGTPITYGCVMLDNVNAKMLYDVAYIGMPVVIKP